jgi:hypothetical protein
MTLYSHDNYTIIANGFYELHYRDTLLFTTPSITECLDYIAWRKES